MNKIANIRFAPLGNSMYIRPFKMIYEQNGREKFWDLLEIHDSVAVVIYNVTRNVMIFVKQFRPSVYYNHISEDDRKNNLICPKKYPAELGITTELCAGICDKDKSLKEIAQEEVLEECGYNVPIDNFEKIHSWRNVGVNGNTINLFYCTVTDAMKVSSGGGVEDELIDVIEMSVDEVKKFFNEEIIPGPGSMITGFYWFLLNKYKDVCH